MKSMRLKSVSFNNHKREIQVRYTSGKKVILHYGQLSFTRRILRAWVDPETGNRTLVFQFVDSSLEYIPYDQPLALVKDPDFMLRTQIEVLIARIEVELHKKKISKRYLAQQLHTSDNQIQRLFDRRILNKNLEQLSQITSILGLELEFRLKRAA